MRLIAGVRLMKQQYFYCCDLVAQPYSCTEHGRIYLIISFLIQHRSMYRAIFIIPLLFRVLNSDTVRLRAMQFVENPNCSLAL